MTKHWQIYYYFINGNKKRQYKGTICECFHGSRSDAITKANVTQADMSEGNVLVRVTAVPQTSMGLCSL